MQGRSPDGASHKSHALGQNSWLKSICEARSQSAQIAFGESEVTLTCASMPLRSRRLRDLPPIEPKRLTLV
jgi:hypothetical protein